MAERPEADNTARGLWHEPSDPSPWQAQREEPQPDIGWKSVQALPQELQEEPENTGDWHLPRPEDTTFNPSDEVQTREKAVAQDPPAEAEATLSPEDMINQIVSSNRRRTEAPRPEDALDTMSDEGDAALPEDSAGLALDDDGLAGLEALGALDDDDDDAFKMGELAALVSLEEQAQRGNFDDLDSLQADDLSPAERAYFDAVSRAEEDLPTSDEDSASVAARMAEQFAQGDAQADEQALTGETDEESAADFAARMAQQYQTGDVDTGVGQGTQPYPTDQFAQEQERPLSPQEQQLAAQFRDTRREVEVLRQQHQQGQISYDELQSRLSQLTILDPNQNWWMIGYETNTWYRFDNYSQQWVEDNPPVPLTEGGPRTATGEYDPTELPDQLEGSLPYFPDDGPSEYSDYGVTGDGSGEYNQYGQGNYVQEETPLPRPGQPTYDTEATVVGNAFDATQLPDPDQTLFSDVQFDGPGAQQTLQSPSVDYEQNVPYQAPEGAPVYDEQPQADAYADLQQEQRRGLLAILGILAVVILALGIIGVIIGFFGIMSWYNGLVEPFREDIAGLVNFEVPFQDAEILDANGDRIALLISGEGAREEVNIEAGEVSPYLVHAIVSSENASFYEDPGFSIPAIVRAFLQNLSTGEVESGASTVTQQVARRLVTLDNTTSAERKITEIAVALEIANTYSKNEILDLYINDVFFGQQSYGVEAAAQFYFDTSAAELNMAQSALLAGIIPQPNSSNPVANRVTAFNNMRVVIGSMIGTGCLDFQHGQWAAGGEFCVDESTFTDGGNQLLRLDNDGEVQGGELILQIAQVEGLPYQERESQISYPHFVNYVLGEIEGVFGPNFLFERGAVVRTTLIPRIQNQAEDSLQQRVADLQINGVNTGAVLVTDPQTGAIRAMVGSPDFNNPDIDGQVNNTFSFHQPGSTIKPIVYAGALEGNGTDYYTPITILWDVPSAYNVGGTEPYAPTNNDDTFNGPVSLRFALQNSLNVPAVKAYAFTGTDSFLDVAARMGITFAEGTSFGLPSALGANDTNLASLARAYATIANDGVSQPLFAIDSITDADGNPISLPQREQPEQTIPSGVAYLLQNILSDDLSRQQEFGRNTAISGPGLGLPEQNYVAAKTGTSDGARDLLTVGFTNNWVVGVWLGTVDNSETRGGLTGFIAAAPVWNDVMSEALNGRNPGAFELATGVVQDRVCATTGTLAGEDCPNITTDIFLNSQPPPSPTEGFVRTLPIDTWTNLIANEFCPDFVVQRSFANIDDPFATNWLNGTAAGQAFKQRLGLPAELTNPPTGSCQSQGQVIPNIRIVSPNENQVVTGDMIVTGQVAAANLASWQLQVASGNAPTDAAFQAITTANNQPVASTGQLTVYNSTQLQNGTYTLRLFATSAEGGFARVDRVIIIDNPLPTPTPTPPPIPTSVPTIPVEPLPFGND